MVSFADLKKINILQDLSDSMLGKVLPYVQLQLFQERAVIYEEGQRASDFYMLTTGKVLLEVAASETMNISLGSVKPGYAFGWSALLPESSHTAYAICVEPSEVITIPGDTFLKILAEDHDMGHRIMEFVFTILKRRLDRRTSQLLKAIRSHPDIQRLFST